MSKSVEADFTLKSLKYQIWLSRSSREVTPLHRIWLLYHQSCMIASIWLVVRNMFVKTKLANKQTWNLRYCLDYKWENSFSVTAVHFE